MMGKKMTAIYYSSEFKAESPSKPDKPVAVHVPLIVKKGWFFITLYFIVGICTLFFIFDCTYLFREFGPALPTVAGLLFLCVMSSLFLTSFSDPGVIPTATQDEAADIEKQIEVPKYCNTCGIFCPPTSSHCIYCNTCVDYLVERFDHHCDFVGNCVGKRNYRYFYLFLVSLALLLVYILACAIIHLVLLARNFPISEVFRESTITIIVVVACLMSVGPIVKLALYHTCLLALNLITKDNIPESADPPHRKRT